jgi:hypothetical protein
MRLRRVLSEVGDWLTAFGGQMSFGRVASLVIAIVAVLALFVEIPIVSDYAFWFLVGALIIWMGVHSQNTKNRFRWQTMLSIALLLVAIVGGSVRRDPDSERIRLLGSVRRLSRLSWQYQLFFELRSISGLLPSPSPSARRIATSADESHQLNSAAPLATILNDVFTFSVGGAFLKLHCLFAYNAAQETYQRAFIVVR